MITPAIKREYVFSTYVKSKYDKSKDALIVKEIIHEENKPSIRTLSIVENYKRPFWITKPEYQIHKDKREYEDIDKLFKRTSTQRMLAQNIFKELNGYNPKRDFGLSDVNSSPFVYGSDITSNDLLKQEYVDKYGKIFTTSTIAILDFEWDMNNPKEDILAGIVSMENIVHIAMSRKWLGELADTACERVRELINLKLGKLVKDRNIELTLTIHDSPAKIIIGLMKTLHSHKPDFVACWNIEADMDKMIEALDREGIDPAYVFSDPSVPDEYKYFEWRRQAGFKEKSNGERMLRSPSERWHTAYCPASFYFLCQMSTFRVMRAREQQRNSYGLDAILHEFLDLGKMHFDEIPKEITGRLWHQIMQKTHKLLYMVYLFGDGIYPLMLEEKTKDITQAIRPQADTSSFDKFKSNPRRLATDFHFIMLEDSKVIGSTSRNMRTDLDKFIPSTEGWIVTLAAELEIGLGLCVLKEYPDMPTNISIYAYDEDLTSAYPSGGIWGNVSKATNLFVLCLVDGMSEFETREFGINITSVISNPLSLAASCFGMEKLDVYLADFIKEKGL
jgi:hypothetical protein